MHASTLVRTLVPHALRAATFAAALAAAVNIAQSAPPANAGNGAGNNNGNGTAGNNNTGGSNAKGNGNGKSSRDLDWDNLESELTATTALDATQDGSAAWTKVGNDAKQFRDKYPSDMQSRKAAKIAAQAFVRADDKRPDLSLTTRTTVNAFLNDRENPARDRLEVTIQFEQAKLRRATFGTPVQRLSAHASHARELIRAFPDQPEGYGYLLSLAKGESTSGTHALADELLSTTAPGPFKQGAQRVIDRLRMVGKPFTLTGAEPALKAAKGKTLLIYSWRSEDDAYLATIQQLGKIKDAVFIGINLDANAGQARGKAAALKLPGTQFYDGADIDGPLAQQLHLIMGQSIYLVDGKGIVRDVNGHHDTYRKLNLLVLAQGGRS